MNPTSTSDVSLYDLALKSYPASTALQVSPASLKAVSDALVRLLIEQQIPAIIWAKLPRSSAWWHELEQYANLDIAKAMYLFNIQREETEETDEQSASGNTVQPHGPAALIEQAQVPVVSLQLAPENTLRREYFLLIWSPAFTAALLAHRPRSAHSAKIPELTVPMDFQASYGHISQLLDAAQERKQLLLALSSFAAITVEHCVQGLETAIAPTTLHSITANSLATSTPLTTLNDAIAHWQKLKTTMPSESVDIHLLEQFFSKTFQHQEELYQRNAYYRKQAEQVELLQQQNEELTNTLRLKDDFLNNVGQELRTPLTTIKTALSLLGSPSLKPPQRQRYMDLIAKECDRQSSLITSLLDLVRLDQPADQAVLPPIRLSDVVPGVVSTYQPVAEEKGVKLAYTVPEDLPAVACMTNWIKQIVINLLHNGIKYTPSGGQVWVRAKQQGDYVQLEVRDTGIGIAQSEIPKVFDRFYRVRQSADDSSGAGLGLTIVQQLLLHCGGSISVKSKVGEGSVFNILLPVYKQSTDSIA